MLFRKRFWAGIQDGSVTLAFRRWERSNVVAGRSRRTPVGIVDVLSVDEVDAAAISMPRRRRGRVRDGRRGSAASSATDDGRPVFRIEFRLREGPDPRAELAADAELDAEAVADDRRAARAARPGVGARAVDDGHAGADRRASRRCGRRTSPAQVGREKPPFKLDVRKLKNLGLTESLLVGYRLSPRGRSYLRATKRPRRCQNPGVTSKAKAGSQADPGTLEALSEAIESGAGLPAVARAAAQVLGASVAVIDRSSVVLAVAASSPTEEGKLLAGDEGVESVDLRVADVVVGELRFRARGEAESPAPVARMVSALLALEVERSRSGDWASDEAAGEFVRSVLERRVTDRGDIAARAAEVGVDLAAGAGVVMARAHPAGRPGGRLAGAGADRARCACCGPRRRAPSP